MKERQKEDILKLEEWQYELKEGLYIQGINERKQIYEWKNEEKISTLKKEIWKGKQSNIKK